MVVGKDKSRRVDNDTRPRHRREQLYLFKLFPQLRSGALGCAVLQVEDYILE
jgi:hypothetical protein